MKKKMIYIPVAAGALVFGSIVYANTDSNTGQSVTNSPDVQVETVERQQGKEMMGFEEVSEKALAIADGTITDIELDSDDGRQHYDLDIHDGEFEYELELDAFTGELLKQEREKERNDDDDDDHSAASAQNQGGASADAPQHITADEAVQAALAEVSGTVEEVELDHDDGIAYYEVEIEDGRTDHEVYVDAANGNILEIETDHDD